MYYYQGQGRKQDHAEAVKWFRKAAEQGDAKAQFNLGVMYAKGQDVKKTLLAAYAWFTIAVANGYTYTAKKKAIVAKLLTPAQTAQAEPYARELIEKNPKLIVKK
jgi:hypothetical protein